MIRRPPRSTLFPTRRSSDLFHGACHIELKIKGNKLERSLLKFAIIPHGHDEVQSVNADALPPLFFDFFAQPFARNLRPDLVANPRSLFVADPTGLPRKDERGLTG